MYKVFIEDTPVTISKKLLKKAKNSIVIYHDGLKTLKARLLEWVEKDTANTPIFIITSHPDKTFAVLFKLHNFIEAAGGLVEHDGKYLIIKRNGMWDIPKGKLDKGESIEECAVREVEEECGIENPKIDFHIVNTYHTYYYKGKPTIKKTHWYAMKYEGTGELIPQKKENITKAKWCKIPEIDEKFKSTFGSLKEVITVFKRKSLHELPE